MNEVDRSRTAMSSTTVSNMLHDMDDMIIASLLSYLPGSKFLLASKVCKRCGGWFGCCTVESWCHDEGGTKSYGSMKITRFFGGKAEVGGSIARWNMDIRSLYERDIQSFEPLVSTAIEGKPRWCCCSTESSKLLSGSAMCISANLFRRVWFIQNGSEYINAIWNTCLSCLAGSQIAPQNSRSRTSMCSKLFSSSALLTLNSVRLQRQGAAGASFTFKGSSAVVVFGFRNRSPTLC